LFVNIEDKNEIEAVDLKSYKVTDHWSLNGGEDPTGLVIDKSTNRLFAGCQGTLVVMNAENGKVVDKLPIGQGCDGVAFNPKDKMVFSSNGRSATITAIKEKDANVFSVVGNYPTQPGARTIAIDEDNGALFLPTASFEKNNGIGGRPKMIPGTFRVLVVKKVD
jgi:DNA-binding beta-propeller fold protein YncE